MLDFDRLIRRFGPEAVAISLQEAEKDERALTAVRDRNLEDRMEAIRAWLDFYKVLQGFDRANRDAVATAALNWVDSQPPDSTLEAAEDVVRAHMDLGSLCSAVCAKPRSCISLASKVLWLRYPDDVRVYDRLAQDALWVLSKLECGLLSPPRNSTKYAAFVFVWRSLYERYEQSIAAIDDRGYPYRVRIFDRILWLIGEPVYGLSDNSKV